MSSTSPVAAPAAQTKATVAETLAAKVQKHVDTLHAKIQKLTEENAALRAQLHEAKVTNSRMRRIPKKGAAAATAAQWPPRRPRPSPPCKHLTTLHTHQHRL